MIECTLAASTLHFAADPMNCHYVIGYPAIVQQVIETQLHRFKSSKDSLAFLWCLSRDRSAKQSPGPETEESRQKIL